MQLSTSNYLWTCPRSVGQGVTVVVRSSIPPLTIEFPIHCSGYPTPVAGIGKDPLDPKLLANVEYDIINILHGASQHLQLCGEAALISTLTASLQASRPTPDSSRVPAYCELRMLQATMCGRDNRPTKRKSKSNVRPTTSRTPIPVSRHLRTIG